MNQRFTEAMEKVKEQYAAGRPLSLELYREACRFLPGGDTRTATFFLPYPNFIEKATAPISMTWTGTSSWISRTIIPLSFTATAIGQP